MKLIHALAALPFIGILVGIAFADRVEPFVLGMPFILFWIAAWVLLTSVIMAVVYRLDPENREDGERTSRSSLSSAFSCWHSFSG